MWIKKNILWGLLLLALIVLDLFTKSLAERYLVQALDVVPGFFKLAYGKNPGIAFGIPIPNAVMIILIPLLLTFIVVIFLRSCDMTKSFSKFVLALILAGGVGNLISRVTTGGVTDMIAFSFWPSFNLADSYLTIGTFLLIFFYGRIAKV